MDSSIPEFGVKRENEERRDGGCAIVYDPEKKLYAVGLRPTDGLFLLFSGGVAEGEDIQEGILREVIEESGLHDFMEVKKVGEAYAHFHNKAKNVNRVAHTTCLLVTLASIHTNPVALEAHENFSLAWATADEIRDNWERRNEERDYDHWRYYLDLAEQMIG
jgi:8-oxo-dGTP pyrophosphatase MutT (NUDIX family)